MDQARRLLALDVFRGITIAGMILVNNPGSWDSVYSPLLHADWHGCTPTDLVFPFFLFMVGVSVAFALGKRKERGDKHAGIVKKILTRTAIIFGLGLFLAAMPNFGIKEPQDAGSKIIFHYIFLGIATLSVFFKEVFSARQQLRRTFLYLAIASVLGMVVIGWNMYDFSRLRIPGVLQRIALVYGFCGLLFLKTGWRAQLLIGLGLLLLYWGLMTLVPVPDGYPPNLDPTTNLGAWLDRTLLGGHLWSQAKVWDPEGILSTMPAFVTGISGVLTGLWLKTSKSDHEKVSALLAFGAILVTIGLIWDLFFPINKKIWTSSYVFYSSGLALLSLGVIYWLTDVLKIKWWTKPFVVYGTNALIAYVISSIVAKLLYSIHWTTEGGTSQTLGNWLYHNFFTPYLSSYNASLAYALANVFFVLGIAWILYSRKIFIKV